MPKKPRAPKAEATAKKSPIKAETWKTFQKAVFALAAQFGIPEDRVQLAKTREKTGKRSDAWKDLERAVAQAARDAGFIKAYRILRGDDIGISDVDVCVPEAPHVMIDCKYKVDGWSHHTIFDECEEKYITEPGQFLALPTKSGGQDGSLTTIRTEVFFQLLAQACLRQDKNADEVGCPRCPGKTTITPAGVGLVLCKCNNCTLEFQMRESDLPVTKSSQTKFKPKNGAEKPTALTVTIPEVPAEEYPLEAPSTARPFGEGDAKSKKSSRKKVA